MEICVIGAGYVGLTSAAVLADLGHSVYCLDTCADKISSLMKGKVPIFEPGLETLIQKNHARLTFSTPTVEIIQKAPIILIAVGTPSSPSGQTDLTYVKSAIELIAGQLTSYKTIITKSTVPPGTNESICTMLIEKGVDRKNFNIVSNPEFLREGTAISDMIKPDKIVVGLEKGDHKSLQIIQEMYQKITAPYIVTTLSGAEMIKYTSNAFLALKISFINEIARICDQYQVKIDDVVKGISTDPRIGPHFLKAGIGYGGSCFPKDVRSLAYCALEKNIRPVLLQATEDVNQTQVDFYIDKLKAVIPDLSAKIIAVLGIAFKPNTDDTRYSPALSLIEKLSGLGCQIRAYDPEAHLPDPFKTSVVGKFSVKEAVSGADVVIIATDWDEFNHLNWAEMKKWMNGEWIVDARNCIDPQTIRQQGLQYLGVARS